MNQGDTEILKGLVAQRHRICAIEESDTVVINSCAVLGFTERKILKKIMEFRAQGKKVLVAGCLSAYAPEKVIEAGADSILTPHELSLVNHRLDSSEIIENREKTRNEYPKIRYEGSSIAIIPIAEGCLGRCSYCATRLARGRLRSFPQETIVSEVSEAIAQGYREIQLTAQDTGVYGYGGRDRLPQLLHKVVNLDGDFRVRVGMMNPTFALKILDELVEIYKNRKIYKFLHLPVQSGDNTVLKHMRRGYSVEDFREIVRTFRDNFRRFSISTDIIAGYPVENSASFEATLSLIEEIKPEIINITRFSPREGTEAADLEDIHDYIKKERSRRLSEMMKRIGYENNKRFIGKRLKVLITKPGKNNTLLARSDSYNLVVVKEGKIGEFREITVKTAKSTYMIA